MILFVLCFCLFEFLLYLFTEMVLFVFGNNFMCLSFVLFVFGNYFILFFKLIFDKGKLILFV